MTLSTEEISRQVTIDVVRAFERILNEMTKRDHVAAIGGDLITRMLVMLEEETGREVLKLQGEILR